AVSGESGQMGDNIRALWRGATGGGDGQALKELADVSGTNDAVDVLCLCIDIADQDGIGAEEQEQLKKIAQALQLPLEQYI
ncbi:tellurite/colicin resistance protein, partial [Escherichia coli]